MDDNDADIDYLLDDESEELTKRSDMSDVTFVVQEKRIYHVRAVLAYHSARFKELLLGERVDRSKEIQIRGCRFIDFLALLKLLKTQHTSNGKQIIRDSNVEKLLELAALYQLPLVTTLCENFILTTWKFNEAKTVDAVRLAGKFGLRNAQRDLLTAPCANYPSFINDSNLEQLLEIAKQYRLESVNEKCLQYLLEYWRKQHTENAVGARLASPPLKEFVDQAALVDVASGSEQSRHDDTVVRLLDPVIDLRAATHSKETKDSPQADDDDAVVLVKAEIVDESTPPRPDLLESSANAVDHPMAPLYLRNIVLRPETNEQPAVVGNGLPVKAERSKNLFDQLTPYSMRAPVFVPQGEIFDIESEETPEQLNSAAGANACGEPLAKKAKMKSPYDDSPASANDKPQNAFLTPNRVPPTVSTRGRMVLAASQILRTGTPAFIEWLEQQNLAEGSRSEVVKLANGHGLCRRYFEENAFRSPIIVQNSDGLGIRLPDFPLTVDAIAQFAGVDRKVDVVDVLKQTSVRMSLGNFAAAYKAEARPKILDSISLEVSDTELSDLIKGPQFVAELNWVDKYWPEDGASASAADAATCASSLKPELGRFILVSMANSFTDFEAEFSGANSWYHLLQGEYVFYFAPPTDRNLAAYAAWRDDPKSAEHFLGKNKQLEDIVVARLRPGQTLLMPSGWLRAIFKPLDSIMLAGSFLTNFSIQMQIRVFQLEISSNTHEKFVYPHFEFLNFLAARGILNDLKDILPEHVNEKKDSVRKLLRSGKRLSAFLKPWFKDMKLRKKRARDEVMQLLPMSDGDALKLLARLDHEIGLKKILQWRCKKGGMDPLALGSGGV